MRADILLSNRVRVRRRPCDAPKVKRPTIGHHPWAHHKPVRKQINMSMLPTGSKLTSVYYP